MIDIEGLLPRVSRPARYAGGELNAVHKDWGSASTRIALVYPDVYEVGMSNLGIQILYDLVNREADFLAERAYAPWVDMETLMRDRGVRLFSLESRRPLAEFDLLGISLSLELTYTNALNVLDLSGMPVLAAERDDRFPIVIAGGSGGYNPEPMAPFFDLFAIGDGEELLLDLLRLHGRIKGERSGADPSGRVPRAMFLREAAKLEGVYVPSLYRLDSTGYPTPAEEGAPATIRARRIAKLGPSPVKPVVPFVEAVHDRAMVEVQRGCTRGCRFCQAGMIYRPVWERLPQEVLANAEELIANTGYDELSLVSLSTADYSGIETVTDVLGSQYPERRIASSKSTSTNTR